MPGTLAAGKVLPRPLLPLQLQRFWKQRLPAEVALVADEEGLSMP